MKQEKISFKELDKEGIENLKKGRLVMYTKDQKAYYSGYVDKIGRGILTRKPYLFINGINISGNMYQERLKINKKIKIFVFDDVEILKETKHENTTD